MAAEGLQYGRPARGLGPPRYSATEGAYIILISSCCDIVLTVCQISILRTLGGLVVLLTKRSSRLTDGIARAYFLSGAYDRAEAALEELIPSIDASTDPVSVPSPEPFMAKPKSHVVFPYRQVPSIKNFDGSDWPS